MSGEWWVVSRVTSNHGPRDATQFGSVFREFWTSDEEFWIRSVCVCVSSQLLSHDNTVVHFSNKIIVSFFKWLGLWSSQTLSNRVFPTLYGIPLIPSLFHLLLAYHIHPHHDFLSKPTDYHRSFLWLSSLIPPTVSSSWSLQAFLVFIHSPL